MMLNTASFVFALTLATAPQVPAIAGPDESARPAAAVAVEVPAVESVRPLSSSAAAPPAVEAWMIDTPVRRPAALPAFYVSLGALQILDVYSTRKAIAAGALEANPLIRKAPGNTGAMIAVKAAAMASTIYFTERAWKKNKKAAVIMMAAINGAMAGIVAINLRNAR